MEKRRAHVIVAASVLGTMLRSINLNNQPLFGAVKVNDVMVDASLKSKFESAQLPRTQRSLQHGFLRRRSPPEAPSALFHFPAIEDCRHASTLA